MSKNSKDVFIIAEIAQAHDGSLGMAHSYIDAASKAGADAVKFQTHIAEAESTASETWRVKFSQQDASRYDYWKRMEFTKEQWEGLKRHCENVNIEFLSSPFSVEAFEILSEIGINYWKIASGEVNNTVLFEKIIGSGLPVILSTGMSPIVEIDKAVEFLKKGTDDITVMQCTSMYPTPAEKIGLNNIDFFKNRYGCKAGLSDHSGNIFASLAAAALGADMLEVHLTFSRDSFGPDVSVSLTVEEFKLLTDGVRQISIMRNNPVNKDHIADELKGMKQLFGKSIVAREKLLKGAILTKDKLAYKKPGLGLPPDKVDQLLGKKTLKDIERDQIIKLSDIE
jgi:N,N'-diacetyllegionaminate synthase